jgi:hypothetical protein
MQEYTDDKEAIRKEFEGMDYVIVRVKNTPPPDSQGNVYDTPPFVFPLISESASSDGSSNVWAYCKGHPELQPNGLWKPPSKSRMLEKGTMVVDLKNDIDFAVYLFKKSKVFKGSFIVVDDPGRDARERGKAKRRNLLISSLVWGELSNDDELRDVAAAWGLSGTDNKEPDMLREELESLLSQREDQISKGKNVKGVDEFMKLRKNKKELRLRTFVQKAIDGKFISYDSTTRKYSIGKNDLVTVPMRDVSKPFDYLCNMLDKEEDEIKKVVKEVVDEKYIDGISKSNGGS